MNIPSPRAQKRARIEIIPLIDIVFFLLATFVMVSLSMVKNQGISVNLPIAATSAAQERKEGTTISVNEKGDYFFNKEPITLEQLPARLTALKNTDPDPRVFINGDQKAEFGKAIAVLDEVRKLGISKVAIETKTK
ncbi:MAG: biopolymer transporter ExbD [Chthoniobacter sp.]|uniref:ExbD/TolR family protein n=1 Tax=Chthoniobacter sp. TaxID=2510640 RepID=UPI0032A50E48